MANNGLVIRFFAETGSAVASIGKLDKALGRTTTAGEKWNAIGKKVGAATLTAAAAAGALAMKIGVDAVQATMAEEQELVRLNKTLENLGFAEASAGLNLWIDNMQYAANVADTDLRDAFGVLLRGTRDVEEAQRALAIAVDVSAGSGRGLAAVAQAMSRGYLGNATGLSRLNAGLDKATLKTGDMQVITKKLADTYGGAASAQSRTLGGSIKGVQIAFDELSESLGAGLVGTADDDVQELQKIEAQLRNMQPAAENLGGVVRDVGVGALSVFDNFSGMTSAITGGDWDLAKRMLFATNEELVRLNMEARSAGAQFGYTQYDAYALAGGVDALGGAMGDASDETDGQTESLKRQRTAADMLKSSLDKLNGKNRSVAGDRLALRRMRAEGPGKTRDDKIEFALQYAQGAESLASSLTDRGQTAAARKVLNRSNRYLGGIVGGNMADDFLSTPAYLDRGNRGQRAAGQRMGSGETNNYYFSGTWMVANPEQVVEQQKRAKRLRALAGPQSVASGAAYGGYAG